MEAMCLGQTVTEDYTLVHGDCCDVVRHLPDESIGFGIHSPPFANLYIYSDSECDMGNCDSHEEFFEHYKFLIPELLRTTITGRLCAVHCKDLPRYAGTHGTAGLIDFPGAIIRAFEECGWSYHSRVTIWKCPVVERERTNNNGLLHKTILRDRSQVRQGMADYLIVFRKPPVGTLMSDQPIASSDGLTEYIGDCSPFESTDHPSPYARKKRPDNRSIAIWQRYAEPVWWDISQTNVLNYKAATAAEDERHICPLQLGVIERATQLWSNEGDVVLSPFAGIGSEGYVALKMGRKFVGVELKESYYRKAIENLNAALESRRQKSLF